MDPKQPEYVTVCDNCGQEECRCLELSEDEPEEDATAFD